MDIRTRFQQAALLAEHYENFVDFATDGMAFLGFDMTWMQADIAEFMQNGPRLRMVMAQRGEAKSTLAALYAVWRIIQQPSTRVLIVSGGEKQASEVAYLVIRIITTWDILECFRPDRQAGDRSSVEAFDVHWSLKGLEKSPSVACVGITSNLPGKRADLLIPDDIETNKNGLTVTQRELLMHLSKEFSSICTHGDILYLGTPQSKDSIYNTLPSRGYEVRIWPGRFPTQEEREKYGARLAPSIVARLAADASLSRGGGLDGTKGKPADPARYDEAALQEKELDKGPEDFQLQYMLDTSLVDALRQQLKLSDFLVANYEWENLPEISIWQAAEKHLVQLDADFPVPMTKMYHPVSVDCRFQPAPKVRRMFIDPAGGGSDEIGFGISTALGPYIHVLCVGGLRGGFTEANEEELAEVIRIFGVSDILVESNMGHGLFEINLRAALAKRGLSHVGVRGEYSTGQKERRVIDSLVSSMQRHRVVLHKAVFSYDAKYCKKYSIEQRAQYSVFYQISNITTDRGSLPHDDRIEALAGCVRMWKGELEVDEGKAEEARQRAKAQEFLNNPMGYAEGGNANAPRGARGLAHRRRGRK